MSPFDAILPPKQKKRPSKKSKTSVQKEFSNQVKSTPPPSHNENKERVMWIMVGVSTLIILAGWIFFGRIDTAPTNSEGSSYFGQIEQKLGDLWQSIKSPVFSFSDSTPDNTNVNTATTSSIEEETINKLEQEIFPQFTDPTKQ